jgi:hypothetical protein
MFVRDWWLELIVIFFLMVLVVDVLAIFDYLTEVLDQ